MNRCVCILLFGLSLMLSSCGPLRRMRTRRAVAADGAIMAAVPVWDTTVIALDSPGRLGPFPDTPAAATDAGVPELVDDSPMAMPWWMMELEYTTFSGRAKARYESSDESRDFILSVRIESGKRIWMSVVGSALGISMEAFRTVLTPDSMIAINRIDKEVIRAPFGEISSLFPIEGDFYTLEAILTGKRLPGAQALHPIIPDTLDGMLHVMGNRSPGTQWIDFRLSDSVMVRQSLTAPGSKIELRHDAYELLTGRKFAKKRSLRMESAQGTQTLDLEYTSFSFDEPVDMSINIPPKYKQR